MHGLILCPASFLKENLAVYMALLEMLVLCKNKHLSRYTFADVAEFRVHVYSRTRVQRPQHV